MSSFAEAPAMFEALKDAEAWGTGFASSSGHEPTWLSEVRAVLARAAGSEATR